MSSTDSVTPDPPDPINELVRLFDEARSLAGEVGEQLATGAASEELTAKLKRQADTTTRLHSLLAEFSMDKTGRPRPEPPGTDALGVRGPSQGDCRQPRIGLCEGSPGGRRGRQTLCTRTKEQAGWLRPTPARPRACPKGTFRPLQSPTACSRKPSRAWSARTARSATGSACSIVSWRVPTNDSRKACRSRNDSAAT